MRKKKGRDTRKKAGQRKKHNNKKTEIYHKETKCKMIINTSNKKFEEKHERGL